MKKYVLLFLVQLSGWSYACRCGMQGIYTYYKWAKFVGEIEIVNVADPINGDAFVKIKSLKKYKGNVPEGFYADVAASCGIRFKKGEKFLIYLNFHQGKYKVNACTRKVEIGDNSKLEIKKEKKVISYLSKKNFSEEGAMILFDDKENALVESYRGLNAKSDFAVLKIRTADDPDKIEKIRVLRRFGTSKDDEIYKLIEEKGILLSKFTRLGTEHEEFIIILFYHRNDSNKEVISVTP
ncbi:hypothetical protein [Elizabethkingia miricola]|uniref:Uncharacterized protein n=1 Tax=Elizabethkingia miricola TaxID=172045 RepID=A0ABD5B552_ELIMR|nr:hypothetical protein [Elizabethkingia miricola]MDQ8749044.1 hypothetical protein [Elizabethkingia miricola]OPB91815.1 hypothetical protein BAS06_00945 [Elizabethkingia miricola]